MKYGLCDSVVKFQSVLLYDVDKRGCQSQSDSCLSLRFLKLLANLILKTVYRRLNEFLKKLKWHISELRKQTITVLHCTLQTYANSNYSVNKM